ncbi:hypothetical protein NP233_g5109 [Leucocoprinus birnbaumii]|uniref:DUF6534 domain-containing protein n=1 Tax=Leucocoprinus birnbaumii TaxID=56174 RepID=A0AAD5YWP9_9AGAR|nr:hypothetical protein NP233_g5109 [Leucocoprinus birnbaumii]
MSAAEQPLKVDNTLGAAFIGVICAAILYGELTHSKDVWYIKGLVALVWIFDTIHQSLICHTGSVRFNVSSLKRLTADAGASLFLCYHKFQQSDNVNSYGLEHHRRSPFQRSCWISSPGLPDNESLEMPAWLSLSSVAPLHSQPKLNILAVLPDVLIAASLFYFLHRSRTGFKKSDTMITRLIVFTVSTGVFTSICAIASLVSILAWGNTLIYVAFYFSLGKLYSNSILATLNARITIRGLGEDSDELSFSLQTVTKSCQPTFNTSAILRPTNISIKIDTTQELTRDHNISDLERSSLSLPPGPAGLPLVGNILDMPCSKEWLTFARWGEEYGDICSVTVLGQPIVIINSARVATDLLDKKSAIYSDRPTLQMAGELVGWKNTLVLLPYGDRFRRYRRFFHKLIGSAAAMKQFNPIEEAEALRFLRRVLIASRAVGATVLRITYGYEAQEFKDPFVQLADQATEQFSLATAPGGFLVDLIPALRHLPLWFPGAGFRHKALAWGSTLCDMVSRPFDHVKQQLAAGTAQASFTSALLSGKVLNQQEELDIRWSAASLYSGASDTTVSAIYSFFLAMTLYPEVARRARSELDEVIGSDRLPTFDDRESLPYMNALVKEVFRWYTVVPAAVPHCSTQDDVHEGYFIPKGTLVIPNIWKFTHDPRAYSRPDEFRPERFLASENEGVVEQDPRSLCFGFGRRVCPGVHFADASVFIVCAMSLAALDIDKLVVDGVVVEPVHEYSTGTISRPKPFKCSIKPRSPRVVSVVEAGSAI